jgi:serine/threonine protein kinase
MSTLEGTVVSERYELGEVLGKGGQGTVYRARDRSTGRGVAVKMLSPGVANNPEFAVRLAREQEVLVALAGTAAVAVYDLCRAPGGSLCLVMELLEGVDLERHLAELERRREHFSKERINAVFEPVVDTLERAHDVGIVHRDVKPSNIFLLKNGGGTKLLDFGLSRMRSAAPLTAAGMVVGSPAYIAPEIWKGQSEAVDGRADVYSLAVILFRCLCGAVPFESESLVDMMRMVTSSPRPSLHAARPDLPRAVDIWVEKALAVDRTQRFEDVRSLWKALLLALEYTPPPRAYRPVAESFVGAWRAATSVFRRFIDAASTGSPEPKAAPATSDPDPDGERPTLIFKRPSPPSIVPETAAIDEGWEEVADSEVHSSALSAAREDAARVASSSAEERWEEITDVEVEEPVTRPRAKKPAKAPSTKAAPGKSAKPAAKTKKKAALAARSAKTRPQKKSAPKSKPKPKAKRPEVRRSTKKRSAAGRRKAR